MSLPNTGHASDNDTPPSRDQLFLNFGHSPTRINNDGYVRREVDSSILVQVFVVPISMHYACGVEEEWKGLAGRMKTRELCAFLVAKTFCFN